MEGFTLVDAGVAIIVLLSGVLAYSRGFVREAMAILGWIGATIVAFIFADQVEPLVRQIPVIGDFIGDSCELAIIAAFAAVFAVALVVVSIFTPLFSGIIQRSALGGVDQALGFFFGVLRGILLVAVAFFVYDTIFATQQFATIDDSRSAQVFAQLTGQIEQQNPEQALGAATSAFRPPARGRARRFSRFEDAAAGIPNREASIQRITRVPSPVSCGLSACGRTAPKDCVRKSVSRDVRPAVVAAGSARWHRSERSPTACRPTVEPPSASPSSPPGTEAT